MEKSSEFLENESYPYNIEKYENKTLRTVITLAFIASLILVTLISIYELIQSFIQYIFSKDEEREITLQTIKVRCSSTFIVLFITFFIIPCVYNYQNC